MGRSFSLLRSFLIEWERHHEDMQRLPDPGDNSICLTEADLRRPGRPNQLSEPLADLPVPDIPLPDEALQRRIVPREDVLEHEAVKGPLRGVALLPRLTLVLHLGDSAALGVQGLIGALAVQKRLAYDLNLGLQLAIPRDAWADIAVREYFAESGKPLKDPSAPRSAVGYLRGGFDALKLTREEISDAIDRLKKSGTL